MSEEQIFVEAYRLYYRKCLLFAQSYTHDIMQAEDIVAEAMIVLWEKLCNAEEISAALPFLIGTIRNKILQYFRREAFKLKVRSILEEDSMRELQVRISTLEECNPQELYYMDVQTILNESLKTMKGKTQTVFILSRFAHKTNEEIARELGIGVKGVEYHITKALKKLRRDLKDFH
ncbi:MAG: RNA polymerase sigma-70 factor [Muribaculaceae bacterium]|nr:RNA polymerase sigma-70 factor [Muribaculaceae bacterium]